MELDVIYNQDCLKGMRLLPDKSIDLVVTSPPYDSLRNYNDSSVWNFNVFKPIAIELFRVVKDGGVVVWIVNDATVKGSKTGTSFKQALFFKNIGFNIYDTMIWQKMSPFQHKNRYIADFEYMFIITKGYPKTTNLISDRRNKCAGKSISGTQREKDGRVRELSGSKNKRYVKEFGIRTNIWDIPGEKNNKTGHPAVFPLRLILDHINTWSNEGDVILDPFLGSGTTAVAAVKSNRHYIGYELYEHYFDIACDRLYLAERARNL